MRKVILIIIILFFLPIAVLAFNPTYKFTDQEKDFEAGLYNFDAREYNPSIGRFLQPDPMVMDNVTELLSDPQSLNPYSYTRNNPLRYIDPTGLSTATYNPMPDGGWQFGDVMGQFNGVVAYYNGIGSLREKHSCVDYAKRYMSDIYGITMGSVTNPNTLWDSSVESLNTRLSNAGSDYSFVQYNNGEGFVLPQEGDLLIWTDNANGHIMVVTESGFNNDTGLGYVEIIDQNASNFAVRTLDVFKTNIGYSIARQVGGNNVPVAGWFSPVSNSTPADNYSYSAPTVNVLPQPQLNFFQNLWNKARDFFRSIF